MDGGDGKDTVSYINAINNVDNKGVIVNLGSDEYNIKKGEASGIDGIDQLWNFENVIGSNYDDTIKGNSLANTLFGAKGNDTLSGGLGVDYLDGEEGNDTVDYSSSNSSQFVHLGLGETSGGEGNDTIVNIENVIGTRFNDTIYGNNENNILDGGLGDDTIFGGDGNDTLLGKSGNDTLSGGLGDDYIDGGFGNNTASYEDIQTGGVTVYLSKSAQQDTINAGLDTLKDIQNLIGSVFKDTLGASFAEVNILNGLGGNDTADYSLLPKLAGDEGIVGNLLTGKVYKGLSVDDTLLNIENLKGTSGKDTLIGNNFNNILDGGAGDDHFVSNGGKNTIIGGDGFDTIDYSSSLKAIKIENLDNAGTVFKGTVLGEDDHLNSIEKIIGSNYKDIIKADSNSTISFVFEAGSGNDTLQGGKGNDYLHGQGGDDYFYASGGEDYIDGGDGIDTIDFSHIDSKIDLTLNEIDTESKVTESKFNGTNYDPNLETHTIVNIENIIGSLNHENTLRGNSLDNTIIGGDKDDTLSGGAGTNYLDGGAGINTVDYSRANNNVTVDLSKTGIQDVYLDGSTTAKDTL